MSREKFSAANSALGYLFQVRVALLLALRRLRTSPDFSVALETLDDVVFERQGLPEALLQAKHHTDREANLTNSCVDLWKTLRIWCEMATSDRLSGDTTCFLLTTATAPPRSAASFLRTSGRNPNEAQRILEETAHTSANQENSAAYKIFLQASSAKRHLILSNITVLDKSPSVIQLAGELQEEIRWSTQKSQLQQLVQRLEGWWFQRVLHQLSDATERILGDEIEAQVEDLSEQFRRDALPIDDDILQADEGPIRTAFSSSTFVRQLALAKIGPLRMNTAIRDFYRALEHRSRWLREELLFVGELKIFERKLTDEWEVCFARTIDDLPSECSDNDHVKASRQVLSWAEQLSVPLRPAMTESFVTRGSLHMLADAVRIGWHPRFRDHFSADEMPMTTDRNAEEEVA